MAGRLRLHAIGSRRPAARQPERAAGAPAFLFGSGGFWRTAGCFDGGGERLYTGIWSRQSSLEPELTGGSARAFSQGMVLAGVAQLVEHLICNQRVGGSNPSASSRL